MVMWHQCQLHQTLDGVRTRSCGYIQGGGDDGRSSGVGDATGGVMASAEGRARHSTVVARVMTVEGEVWVLVEVVGEVRKMVQGIEELGTTSNHQDNSREVDHDDCNKREPNPRLSKEVLLSCVICRA
ncbi:hypothetical protein L1987_01085 [Smallanthus sonchifolius]|uniref:Uncharacterized protein n=1 Tax=Smallanthus sonchifolius TaxID=185202 RepID=A0ACB9K426_9ASTR|nr:hypothetical protein L1987_01085 [Smallanthus sonchifolius]